MGKFFGGTGTADPIGVFVVHGGNALGILQERQEQKVGCGHLGEGDSGDRQGGIMRSTD
jgi:hypothetical protein